MANAKSAMKKLATTTRAQAQSVAKKSTRPESTEAKSSKRKPSNTTRSVSKKSETRAKAPVTGTVTSGAATKSGKPPDKTSSHKHSRESDERSTKKADADVAESAK